MDGARNKRSSMTEIEFDRTAMVVAGWMGSNTKLQPSEIENLGISTFGCLESTSSHWRNFNRNFINQIRLFPLEYNSTSTSTTKTNT